MIRRRARAQSLILGLPALVALLALLALAPLAGCGVKIAIPEPEGLFSINDWSAAGTYDDAAARQLTQSLGSLFVVSADSLLKRDQSYNRVTGVAAGGLADATALCVGPNGQVVFVWNQGTRSLSWYAVDDLEPLGSAPMPDVQRVRAMVADTLGIGQVPGARTFIYLADPDSGVVHRYAFDDFAGPSPYGILTQSAGEGARSVHEAAGMAVDSEGLLLVCDTDTLRNWVIRFDGTPDLEDTTPAPGDQDPLRGRAVEFEVTCLPPAPTDFVLGDAATCGQTEWTGGPSSEAGEFNAPSAVAVDGSGRIFVSDTGNNRIQVFTGLGRYEKQFGSIDNCPAPASVAVIDKRYGTGVDQVDWAAYVYVLTPGTGQVRRFISREYNLRINQGEPPQP